MRRASAIAGGAAWMLLAVAAAGSLAAKPAAETRATVTLRGGAEVAGTLLRENDHSLVVDLGRQVITLDRQNVLKVRRHEKGREAEPARQQNAGRIYRTGTLEPAPVPELVKRFRNAIVTVRSPAGTGTGFLISPGGHVLTNYHVVEQETRISVTIFRKTEQGLEKEQLDEVAIRALHPLRDLALLKLDLSGVKGFEPVPVTFAEDPNVQVGDLVFTIGNPLGLERSVTEGIVSSTTRTIGHLRMVQTDASINPGNSGGPLFNARGEVVGVVAAGFSLFDGLAFGIPASDVLDFLRNREAYVYDPTQPQNGVKYLDPPFVPPRGKDDPASGGDG